MTTLMIVRPGMIAAPSNMRPSPPCLCLPCPRLAWFLGLMLLAGLSGCGPAVSDDALTSKPPASLGASAKSQPVLQGTAVPRNGPFTLAASPVPLAVSPASNYAQAAEQEEPTPLPDHLALPIWIAQALDAPEVSVRLQALDMWAQQGAQAPLDPLVVALDDEDDDVRAKAMAIIEQNWKIDQEAEPEAEK